MNNYPILATSKSAILFYSALRSLSVTHNLYANHYDALGITPKATQSDIKAAYYKLSKIHHPDKSNDETSAKKFRAISEAYEVLGNVKLKKMYDQGLLGRDNFSKVTYHTDPEPIDPALKFYKSHSKRQVSPTVDGKTPFYNFDAWSKHHYGQLFKQKQYEDEMVRILRQKKINAESYVNQEVLMYALCALAGLFISLVVRGTADYDHIAETKSKEQAQESIVKRDD